MTTPTSQTKLQNAALNFKLFMLKESNAPASEELLIANLKNIKSCSDEEILDLVQKHSLKFTTTQRVAHDLALLDVAI